MKILSHLALALIILGTLGAEAQARSYKKLPPPISVEVLKMKHHGGWTEVTVAIENKSDEVLSLECCTAYMENAAGYAVPSLTGQEIKRQVHNSAGAGATIGQIIGLGLGIGGLASGNDALAYTGLGVGTGSTIVSVAGEASANSRKRGIIMDDVMRNQTFPPRLKVAGVVYFPPKKKWPESKEAANLHMIYRADGDQQDISVPVTGNKKNERKSNQADIP
jgi:hypothetical protein